MDKGIEVIKIVEWNLKGQGTCFIFPTAERTFRSGERIFRNGERTFRSEEYKTSTLPF